MSKQQSIQSSWLDSEPQQPPARATQPQRVTRGYQMAQDETNSGDAPSGQPAPLVASEREMTLDETMAIYFSGGYDRR